MLSQRWIIRLLPLEVLALSALIIGGIWNYLEIPPFPRVAFPALIAPAATPPAESAAPQAAPTTGGLSPVFTPEVQRWAPQILAWAAEFQLDPNLVATVMQIESCGWQAAVSTSGAQGLFQVMPFHFAPGEAMQEPAINARRGLAYLARGLAQAEGDVGKALAGYNGGHSQIAKAAAQWPAQTKRYWYWGTGIYAEAAAGLSTSPRLHEWLTAGGASLCARAAGS